MNLNLPLAKTTSCPLNQIQNNLAQVGQNLQKDFNLLGGTPMKDQVGVAQQPVPNDPVQNQQN